jgi:serine/threonine-protein kinase HipA
MQLQIEKYIDGVWWLATSLHIDQPAKGWQRAARWSTCPTMFLSISIAAMKPVGFLHPLSFNHYRCDG